MYAMKPALLSALLLTASCRAPVSPPAPAPTADIAQKTLSQWEQKTRWLQRYSKDAYALRRSAMDEMVGRVSQGDLDNLVEFFADKVAKGDGSHSFTFALPETTST